METHGGPRRSVWQTYSAFNPISVVLRGSPSSSVFESCGLSDCSDGCLFVRLSGAGALQRRRPAWRARARYERSLSEYWVSLSLRVPHRPSADPPWMKPRLCPHRHGRRSMPRRRPAKAGGRPSTSCDARTKEDVDGGAKMLWGWAVAAACILSIVQNQPGACHDRAVCPRRNRLRSQ